MTKGDLTREAIIEKAADLFNQKGFAGCSLSDLMQATGLKKGGIYNHFENKNVLALAAFERAIQRVDLKIDQHLRSFPNEAERLLGIVDFYRNFPDEPVVRGGCPLLNTIIDSDDGHPELKQRANYHLNRWVTRLIGLMRRGQEKGIFAQEAPIEDAAWVTMAVIEGGIALARMGQSSKVMGPLMDYLVDYLRKTLKF